jgi:hypothetical protein
VRPILKFTTTTQLSVILGIQTKCFDTNCNNPAFQAQNNSKFILKKKTASLPIKKSTAKT